LEYLASIRDPERATSLFADDGVFELPFLRSLGVEPRYAGRREITALPHKLLELHPNFAFGRTISNPHRDARKDVPRTPLRPGERPIICSLGTWRGRGR
jgi:hypothetical protein